jgi:hypothetical protein
MSRDTGQSLVRLANRRGMIVFVDTDGALKLYPRRFATREFLDILEANYWRVLHYLIADAVTSE